MGQRDVGRRALGQHDAGHERAQVAVVFGIVADVPLAAVGQTPLRSALAAPVEHRDNEPAPAQVRHHLEILLDEFAATGEQADGAADRRTRRVPAGKAQGQAVGRAQLADDGAARNRVDGKGNEAHECVLRAKRVEPQDSTPLRAGD